MHLEVEVYKPCRLDAENAHQKKKLLLKASLVDFAAEIGCNLPFGEREAEVVYPGG